MFSWPLRVLLIIGSLLTLAFMMQRIRHSKVQIRDSIFWIIFSFILFLLSVFPQVTVVASQLLGFQAPINFVYLFIIFLLLIKLFSSSLQISKLDARLQQLAQRAALYEKQQEQQGEKMPENEE